MRLLPKSEVDLRKAQERKIEIDEGMKLAKKIDVLRETVAMEETNLRKFRESSLEQVRLEITTLIDKRDSLKKEITELQEKKEQLIT